MDIADLEKDLAGGKPQPIYLLHGQETFLKDQILARLTGLVPEGMRDFNLQIILADDTSPASALEQAQTMPFMSPPRVIVLKGIDRYSAEELSLFHKYLEQPNETTCLVLVAEKPDFRLKFYKMIRDKGWDISLQAPRGRGLVVWVKQAMSRRGQEMTDDAAQELIGRIGTDLMELDGELEKIFLYALDQPRVTDKEVRTVGRLGPTANVFMLGDAVGEQRPDEALMALKDLLLVDHHLPVLYMLIRHFRLLLKAGILQGEGLGQAEAAKSLGLPPFVARKYMDQARTLSLGQIKKGLACLLEANLTLISNPAPPRLVMERLVLDLASLRPRRRPEP
jgi:DNA polymerase-3 subunit delta